MNGSDYFDNQPDGRGGVAGPRAQGPLFFNLGDGIVLIDTSGNRWQLSLARNADGTTFIGDDGRPTIELIQVAL